MQIIKILKDPRVLTGEEKVANVLIKKEEIKKDEKGLAKMVTTVSTVAITRYEAQ